MAQGRLSGFAWHIEYHPEAAPKKKKKRKHKKVKKQTVKKITESKPTVNKTEKAPKIVKVVSEEEVKVICINANSKNICCNILGDYYDEFCKNHSECPSFRKRNI